MMPFKICNTRRSSSFRGFLEIKIQIRFQALAEGKPIDLSGMPPPPNMRGATATPQPAPHVEIPANSELDVKEDPTLYKAPPPAQTILESLEQRLAKYEVGFASSVSIFLSKSREG